MTDFLQLLTRGPPEIITTTILSIPQLKVTLNITHESESYFEETTFFPFML